MHQVYVLVSPGSAPGRTPMDTLINDYFIMALCKCPIYISQPILHRWILKVVSDFLLIETSLWWTTWELKSCAHS